MVYRPRTKLVKARKAKRCPKCGVLVRRRVRCKVCHKAQRPEDRRLFFGWNPLASRRR